ncbi:hypothetical protein OIO90_000039 [Microbotryomycetes sp. JL221]|nr:hypothetical protein OIO90_000039 [Microbotryomycetes sp. JL221]
MAASQAGSSTSTSLVTHLRRRSSQLGISPDDNNGYIAIEPFGQPGSANHGRRIDSATSSTDEISLKRDSVPRHNVVQIEDEKYANKPMTRMSITGSSTSRAGGSSGLGAGSASRRVSRGFLTWQDKAAVRRMNASLGCAKILVLLMACMIGWLIGVATRNEEIRTNVGGKVRQAVLKERVVRKLCDPYSKFGILHVNLTYPAENKWQPINAPRSCEPTDFVSLLYDANVNGHHTVETDFMRNRTIVLFGDSVDRDHNHHLCNFIGGVYDGVSTKHPLSPPYPKGEELPAEDYKNAWTGERAWPDFDQSRPYICHVYKLNMRIVNVFHYGFAAKNHWIEHHPHFYPPARAEDRFDKIVKPILDGLSEAYGLDRRPDLVSVTSTFWGIMRHSVAEDKAREKMIEEGASEEEADAKWDVWRTMEPEVKEENYKGTSELIRHVAKAWPLSEKEKRQGILRKPKILWRGLHHIKHHHSLPFSKIQALDQLGRAAATQAILEGKAAEAGLQSWREWTRTMKSRLKLQKPSTQDQTSLSREAEALEMQLGRRLKIDNWADLILGQENHFRDDIHPHPLPASYLYGNMLLHNLLEAVTEREGPQFVYKEDLEESDVQWKVGRGDRPGF